MKRIFYLLLLFGCSIFAQVEYSSSLAISNSPLFYLDAANYKSNIANKARLDIFIEVPYSSVQFIKKGNEYQAGYTVTLTFYEKNNKIILFERIWKEKITVNDFLQTLSRKNFNISYRNFDLNPGSYTMRCILEDSDSRRAGTREYPLELKIISDTLGVSDIMLISEIVKSSDGEKVVPNISKILSNRDSTLSFYYDIYSNKKRDIYIEYTLENLKSKSAVKQMSPQTLTAGLNTIYFTMNKIDFKLGDYELTAVIKDSDWKEITSTKKGFFSKIYGMPNSILDLNKAVEQLMYIAPADDLNYIKEAENYEEKLKRFIEFWDKKKPNKNSDDNPILYEYYRRIDYANRNFKGLSEGWRSDMGMIYVTFGPPNHVERRPFDANSVPYEIWEYYEISRSFVFADYTGFGDYRLVNPDYSRWPGYRQ